MVTDERLSDDCVDCVDCGLLLFMVPVVSFGKGLCDFSDSHGHGQVRCGGVIVVDVNNVTYLNTFVKLLMKLFENSL